jgi:hypothetical protein
MCCPTIAINHSYKLVVRPVVPVFPHLVQASAAELLTHGFQIASGCLQLDAEFLMKILGLLVDHCHDALMALVSCFHHS